MQQVGIAIERIIDEYKYIELDSKLELKSNTKISWRPHLPI